MNDPFDVTNSDMPAPNGGISPDFWRNLMAFGAGMSTAANARDGSGFLTYGGGLAGPLGAGIQNAQQASRQNAQTSAETALTRAQATGAKLGALQNLMAYNLRAPLYGMPRMDINGNPLSEGNGAAGPMSAAPNNSGVTSQPAPMSSGSSSTPQSSGITPVSASGNDVVRGLTNPVAFQGGSNSTLPTPQARAQQASAPTGQPSPQDMQVLAQRVLHGELPRDRGDAGNLAAAADLMGMQGQAEGYRNYAMKLPEMQIFDPNHPGQTMVDPTAIAATGATEAAKQGADLRYAGPIASATAWGKAPAEAWTGAMRPETLRGPGSTYINPLFGQTVQVPNEITEVNPNSGEETKKFVPLGLRVTGNGPLNAAAATGDQNANAGVVTKLAPGKEAMIEGAAGNYTKEGRKAFESAQDLKGSIEYIKRDLDTMGPNGFLAVGSGADLRGQFARAINSAAEIAGGGPLFDPNKVGAWEDFSKESTLGGMKGLATIFGGSREAASIVHSSMGAFPKTTNSYDGARLLVNAFDEAANREIDQRNFETNWAQGHGGNLIGANEAFQQKYPAPMYARRAISQVRPYPIKDPSEAARYLPGTRVQLRDGRIKLVPGEPGLALNGPQQ